MQIVAQSISVQYGPMRVIDHVTLTLRRGECVGLIGPNGAGKSTLLRALAGLQSLAAGQVTWDGKTATAMSAGERARAIAYLAQKQTADWPLRAYDVVMLGRLPHRGAFQTETAFDHAAVGRALDAVDMTAFGDRVLDQLSGGERARIMLARALAVEAPLLFADEPVAALDPLHQLRVMDLLRARVMKGEGVVVVLHDLALAMRYCDRIIVLDHGHIRMDGPPSLLSDQLIAEVYGVDVFRAKHDRNDIVVPWRVAAGNKTDGDA